MHGRCSDLMVSNTVVDMYIYICIDRIVVDVISVWLIGSDKDLTNHESMMPSPSLQGVALVLL